MSDGVFRMKRLLTVLYLAVACAGLSHAGVPKWEYTEIAIANPDFSGNPFDIDFVGHFTDPGGDRAPIRQWGYYAGGTCSNNAKRCVDDGDCSSGTCTGKTWKIHFMCDEVGTWSWTTTSSTRNVPFMGQTHQLHGDADLVDSSGGTFTCDASSNTGPLRASGNRWKYDDGGYTSPIIYSSNFYIRDLAGPLGSGSSSAQGDTESQVVNWLKNNGATIVGTDLLLVDRVGTGPYFYTLSQEDRIYVDQSSGDPAVPDITRFYLPVWDRMESFYKRARDNGIGIFIRFYADDGDDPNGVGISGADADEFRLFRYAIARLAPHPTVVWDTGIDIGETRNQAWINNFTAWFRENDPWEHPVASRFGGGSGGHDSTHATHRSDGDNSVDNFAGMINRWNGESRPILFTDHWREDNAGNAAGPGCSGGSWGRGKWCETVSCGGDNSGGNGTRFGSNHDRYLIRGAAWQILFVPSGAIFGNLVRCRRYATHMTSEWVNEVAGSEFEAAPDIEHRNDFLDGLLDYGNMTPDPSLLTSGSNVFTASNGSNEFMAYALKSHSANFSLNLSSASGSMTAYWFNPTTGATTSISGVNGGGNVQFTPPNGEDWALHVHGQGGGQEPTLPPAPASLQLD